MRPTVYPVHGMRGVTARNDDGTSWCVEAHRTPQAGDPPGMENFMHGQVQASCSLRFDGAAYCYSQAQRAGWQWLAEVLGLVDKSRAFADTKPGTLANEIDF